MSFQLKLRPRSGVIWRDNLTIFVSFFCKHSGSVQYFRTADRLFAYQMPGRFEAIEKAWQQVKSEAVGAIVCLVERYEIRLKSSAYAEALEAGTVPCSVLPFEIPEGGVPEGRNGFWAPVNDVANRLQSGKWC